MTKWVLGFGAAVLALVVLPMILGGHKAGALNVVGSTSIQPFAEMLAQEYEKSHPDRPVDVQGGGSTAGLQAAANGIAEVGTCSRGLKDKEKQEVFKVAVTAPDGSTRQEEATYRTVTIARDGLAIVVHPSNPVDGLTNDQVRAIFEGAEIVNWNQVGGSDRSVRLITREEGSGTREAFSKMVMRGARISRRALTQESNGAVKELVKHDPCAIGYMSLGLVHGELKALKIDGVEPTAADVVAGRYPLVRPFLFVTRGAPTERARQFIDYVLSPEGQHLLETEGLVGAGEKREDH
jgi:phosphate transport system substrate-binding protein